MAVLLLSGFMLFAGACAPNSSGKDKADAKGAAQEQKADKDAVAKPAEKDEAENMANPRGPRRISPMTGTFY